MFEILFLLLMDDINIRGTTHTLLNQYLGSLNGL